MSLSVAYSQRGTIVNHGTKSLSMGGISSSLKGSDALLNNFSAIVGETEFSGLLSSERRFELEELTSAILGVHLPVEFGHIGLVVSSYGFSEYKEQKLSLAYARKLSKYLSVSANFDYNSFRINSFGNKSVLSFGIGFFGKLSDNLNYGIYLFNPEKIEIAEATEIPGFINVSLSYKFNEDLTLYSEIEKVIDEEINFKLGVAYQMIDKLSIYTGFNSLPGAFSFGLSYKMLNIVTIEGGTQYDTLLGITPGITVKYRNLSGS
ncbi:MAG: hypothetical protein HKN51_14255 [Saprospiraceae bacterium]|nr:hypothetical protein [Bacteroidia bacterium]NNE16144.1 hypothetical protein [Saprospiraceae bacterium]